MNVTASSFDVAMLETLSKLDKTIPRRQPGYGITAREYFDSGASQFKTADQSKRALDALVKCGSLRSEKMTWKGYIVTVYTKA